MAAVAEALTFSRAGWSSVLRRRLLAHLVVDKPSSLDELGDLVCYMACKQKPVSRLHLVGKSHECQGIAAEGEGHPPTDDLWRLLHVIDGSNGETPVGNWTPEVRAHQVVPEVLAVDIVRRLAHQRPSHGRAWSAVRPLCGGSRPADQPHRRRGSDRARITHFYKYNLHLKVREFVHNRSFARYKLGKDSVFLLLFLANRIL